MNKSNVHFSLSMAYVNYPAYGDPYYMLTVHIDDESDIPEVLLPLSYRFDTEEQAREYQYTLETKLGAEHDNGHYGRTV